MSDLYKNIQFIGNNNIKINDFDNPWNDRDFGTVF